VIKDKKLLTQKPSRERTISDRLYYDNYYVEKVKICTYIFLPAIKKVVQYKFHICTLEKDKEHRNHSEYLSELRKGKYNSSIDTTDLTEELKRYCPEPQKHPVYFFIETLDKAKQLPVYYGILYLGDYCDNWENNTELNYGEFMKEYQDSINYLMYDGRINPALYYEYFYYLHYLGDAINEYVDVGTLSAEVLDEYEEKLESLKEPALRYYMQDVINTVVQQAYKDKQVMRCQFCNRIIDYAKGKKFCSLKNEGRDCGKQARNKIAYEKRKAKNRKAPTEITAKNK